MRQRQTRSIVFCVTAAAWLALTALHGCRSEPNGVEKRLASVEIELTSTAFADGQPIPAKYTADGDDVSPPLSWSDLPEGTEELALIGDDPDAPRGTWVHWVVYKIPATAGGLPEAIAKQPRPEQPAGIVQGRNSWPAGQNVGYGGPAPPSGRHRYFFRLFALDTELPGEPGWDKGALLEAIQGHVLAEGRLMGTYER